MIQDNSKKEVLIIGGTGMLMKASHYFLQQYGQVHLLARNKQKLEETIRSCPNIKASYNLHCIDYSNSSSILNGLKNINHLDMIISWVHSNGLQNKLALFKHFQSQNSNLQIYDILGSASYNPSEQLEQSDFEIQKIVLGFKIEKGQSRWLTHDEISQGCIEAIKLSFPVYIIGETEPWNRRP